MGFEKEIREFVPISRREQLFKSRHHLHTYFIEIVASSVLLFAFQLVLLARIGEGSQASDSSSPFSEDFINSIEKANSTWQTKRNFDESFSKDDLLALTGLHPNHKMHKLQLQRTHSYKDTSIPDEFDARKKWPNCPTIREIRDQGRCGSCWAVSAVSAMSDRLCVHSEGAENFHFSAEDLISCCTKCGDGCGGGYPDRAWEYWKTTGIVSGGNYGSKDEDRGCRPYTIKPTDKKNAVTTTPTPKCIKECVVGYNVTYQDDLRFGIDAYAVEGKVEVMQQEVLNNGPIVVGFIVYEDFLSYGDGVYQHVQGGQLGGHAVKLIGWGTDPSTKVPYWLIANSWGTRWGKLNGFFKIKRGSDECGIEDLTISAGLPKLKKV